MGIYFYSALVVQGAAETAISYLTRRDCVHADKLIEILEGAKQIVPDELRDMRSGRR